MAHGIKRLATLELKGTSISLSESGFVLRKAPPPLFRNRRIKMKKSSSLNHFLSLIARLERLRYKPFLPSLSLVKLNAVSQKNQIFMLYSQYYTPKRVANSFELGLHSSEETSQRWRVVGDTDGPGFEPKPTALITCVLDN